MHLITFSRRILLANSHKKRLGRRFMGGTPTYAHGLKTLTPVAASAMFPLLHEWVTHQFDQNRVTSFRDSRAAPQLFLPA
jgi:hypothetical protein